MFDATDCIENTTPIERRRDRRQRTFLHGKLVFPLEGVSQDCTVRNLSGSGAHLETATATLFTAGSFVLITKTGAAHEFGLVWRRGARSGIRFTATHDLNDDVPPGLRGLRRLWVEHRAR